MARKSRFMLPVIPQLAALRRFRAGTFATAGSSKMRCTSV